MEINDGTTSKSSEWHFSQITIILWIFIGVFIFIALAWLGCTYCEGKIDIKKISITNINKIDLFVLIIQIMLFSGIMYILSAKRECCPEEFASGTRIKTKEFEDLKKEVDKLKSLKS